jgi:hypothetical protein
MLPMSNRAISRGRNGRYESSTDKREVSEQRTFAKPKGAMQSQEQSQMDFNNPKKAPENVYSKSNRVLSLTPVFYRVTAALQLMTKVILAVLILYTLKNTIQGDNIQLGITLGKCLADKEASCHERVQQDFFGKKVEKHRWVIFAVTESNMIEAPHLFDVSFPLVLDNPVVLFVALVAMAIVHWLLGYLCSYLKDVNDTANEAISQQRLPRRGV